jgi:hypothetical protein
MTAAELIAPLGMRPRAEQSRSVEAAQDERRDDASAHEGDTRAADEEARRVGAVERNPTRDGIDLVHFSLSVANTPITLRTSCSFRAMYLGGGPGSLSFTTVRTPIVTEIRPKPEPVARDPFIDDLRVRRPS